MMKPMSRWRRLWADRRGVAIEMALLMMVITASLSILLTTTSLLQHQKKTIAERDVAQHIVMEQIGQRFCAAFAAGEDHSWTAQYPEYTIIADGSTLSVTDSDDGEALLYVELIWDPLALCYRVATWNER